MKTEKAGVADRVMAAMAAAAGTPEDIDAEIRELSRRLEVLRLVRGVMGVPLPPGRVGGLGGRRPSVIAHQARTRAAALLLDGPKAGWELGKGVGLSPSMLRRALLPSTWFRQCGNDLWALTDEGLAAAKNDSRKTEG